MLICAWWLYLPVKISLIMSSFLISSKIEKKQHILQLTVTAVTTDPTSLLTHKIAELPPYDKLRTILGAIIFPIGFL